MPVFGRLNKPSFECHFCSQDTTNPTLYKSGWICPNPLCAQYNGFDANGDYNVNILSEFADQTQSHPSSYCKPCNLPFRHIASNVFQSNAHFTPHTYIATPSGAPLCHKCERNQRIIVKKLRAFDAGANSDYSAYTQHRHLLERTYSLCNQCKKQCEYRLNTIDHNAKLWQKYEHSLPPPNLSAFQMKSNRINNVQNHYCFSLLARFILNSIMIYLSFFISVIGASNLCDVYLLTPFHIITNCEVQIGFIRCHDANPEWKQCLYVHKIKSEYVSNHVLVAAILLPFVFVAYDRKKHKYLWYILWILSLIIVILMPICEFLWNVYNLMLVKQINIGLQIGMIIICLLFITRTKSMEKKPNDGNDFEERSNLLSLLEQQEIEEHKIRKKKRYKHKKYARNDMKNTDGLNMNRNRNRNVERAHHEPMDICHSPTNITNVNHNRISPVQHGLHSLHLNGSF